MQSAPEPDFTREPAPVPMSGARSGREGDAPSAAPEPGASPLDELFGTEAQPVVSYRDPNPEAPAEEKVPAGKIKTRKARKSKDDPQEWPLRVPVPGGRLRGGRGASLGLRYGLLAGSTVLAAALIGVTAYGMGRASVPDVPQEVDKAVSKYGLSTFNDEAAGAYAEDYLRSCLRRYKQTPSTPAKEEEPRLARLKQMSVIENDPACASAETSTEVEVLRVRPVGKPQPVEGVDTARYVTLQATTSESTTSRYSVAVSLDDPANGVGARVVGHVGILPVPKDGNPAITGYPAPAVDNDLSREWETAFIPEVMTAWVASDDLSQYLISEATPAASQGLQGRYKDVKVTGVRVNPEAGTSTDKDTGDFVYTDGDEVVANVDLTMTSKTGTSTGSTYRVTLRKQGDHWFIRDVQGGGVASGEPE